MVKLKNDLLVRALLREPVDRTPVWLMRQAGRYLPEYRKLREKAGDFLTLCKTPELACEVTLQPIQRFPLDAAIIFSDILTIPDAMGLGLRFSEGMGPYFERPLRTAKQISALTQPDVEEKLGYVLEAIRCVTHELNGKLPLIGFAGSPWTLATYMIEGGKNQQFSGIKRMLFDEPALLHTLLASLAEVTTVHLNAQIEAGANAVMLFDTWGGILSPWAYKAFSLRYMTHIISGLTRKVDEQAIPVILFTKNGGQWIETIADSGCDAIGLDWTMHLGEARARVGDRVTLQGNLDPAVLYAQPDKIRKEVANVLRSYGGGTGHIFNLGHGIPPDVSPEHVGVAIDAVIT